MGSPVAGFTDVSDMDALRGSWKKKRGKRLHDLSPKGDPKHEAESERTPSDGAQNAVTTVAWILLRPSLKRPFPLSSLPSRISMSSSPPRSSRDLSLDTLEDLVGRRVDDLSLYQRALTHRSLLRVYPEESLESNERLEYLGDAFLDLVVGERLYEQFPDKNEGELSRLRARLVSETPLARYARRLDLGNHLFMSKNAARGNGRDNPSILADAFEALVGAVYLDLGHDEARRFVFERALAPFDLVEMATRDENYKSQLLERMQAQGRPQPTYPVVSEEGPSHDKTFTVEVKVGDSTYQRGTAGNKQTAEQQAARRTLAQLSSNEPAAGTESNPPH